MDQNQIADIEAKKAALQEELKAMQQNKANADDIASVQAMIDALAKDEGEPKQN